MINKIYERTIRLIGEEKFSILQKSSIFLAGVGGVGSYVAESLVRAGIGNLTIADKDIIEISNINRQIHALKSTIGLFKVDVMAERLLEINSNLNIKVIRDKLDNPINKSIINGNFDCIIDAVDDIPAKIALVLYAKENEIPIILSMGTANRLDNRSFVISDISKTKICPLARKMRYELKKYNICSGLKVLYNESKPLNKGSLLGTISFVPATAGLFLVGEVIRDLIESKCV